MSLLDKIKAQIMALIDTANAKTGKTDADLTTAVTSLVDGYGGSGVDDLVSTYSNDINRLFYASIFPENFELNLNMKCTITSISYFVANSNVKKVKLSGVSENCYCTFAFSNASYLTEVDLLKFDFKPKTINYCFGGAVALQTIKWNVDLSNTTYSNAFEYLYALENITFKPNTLKVSIAISQSSKLSDDSIQSIIDGLATVETAQTLTLHAAVKAKLTEEQIATITSKNWTLA